MHKGYPAPPKCFFIMFLLRKILNLDAALGIFVTQALTDPCKHVPIKVQKGGVRLHWQKLCQDVCFPHCSAGSFLFLCCHGPGVRSKGSSTCRFIPVIQEILAYNKVQYISQSGSGNPLTVLMCEIGNLV